MNVKITATHRTIFWATTLSLAFLVLLLGTCFIAGVGYVSSRTQGDNIELEARLDAWRIERRFAKVRMGIENLEAAYAKAVARYMRQELVREVMAAIKSEADDAIRADIVMRLIERESQWNPRAVGSQGEIGLMQIKPTTAGLTSEALFDPVTNIKAGMRELRRLTTVFGDVPLAVVAYGTGQFSSVFHKVVYVLRGESASRP